MIAEEWISLDCPCCHNEIYQPLAWFKQPYFTCPDCGGGLAAGQFAAIIAELEDAFEANAAGQDETPAHQCGGCGCGGGKSCA